MWPVCNKGGPHSETTCGNSNISKHAVAVVQPAGEESMNKSSDVRDCLIDLSWRNWKKQDWQSAATWSAMVSWLSSRMQRSFTAVDNCTVAFGKVRTCAVTLSSCWRVPNEITCLFFVQPETIAGHPVTDLRDTVAEMSHRVKLITLM